LLFFSRFLDFGCLSATKRTEIITNQNLKHFSKEMISRT